MENKEIIRLYKDYVDKTYPIDLQNPTVIKVTRCNGFEGIAFVTPHKIREDGTIEAYSCNKEYFELKCGDYFAPYRPITRSSRT